MIAFYIRQEREWQGKARVVGMRASKSAYLFKMVGADGRAFSHRCRRTTNNHTADSALAHVLREYDAVPDLL